MARHARHPDPPPLQTDDVKIVLVGTVLWALALVVLLVLRVADAAEVRDWWLGMCLYGIALGLFGVRYVHRRTRPVPDDVARDASPRS